MTPGDRNCVICGARSAGPTCGSPWCLRAYSLQLASSPGRRTCAVCGRVLGPSAAGPLCVGAACRRAWDLRRAEERGRREGEALEARLKESEAAARRRLGRRLPADAPCVLLDFFDPPVRPLPRSRRSFHEAHLWSVVEGSGAEEPDRKPSSLDPGRHLRSLEPLLKAVSAAACAACGGLCCRRGGDRGFIDREVLRRWRREHPGAAASGFVADYLGRVPRRTRGDSCVYHARDGCALPPAMRPLACLQYYCDRIQAIHDLCRRGAPGIAMLAVRVEGLEVRPAAVLRISGPSLRPCPSWPSSGRACTSSLPSSGRSRSSRTCRASMNVRPE